MFREILKTIPGSRAIAILLRKTMHNIIFTYIKLFGKVDEKKVVFQSFHGRTYSCNPRAIAEKLYEMMPDMKIVWIFRNPSEKKAKIPEYITPVKVNARSEEHTSELQSRGQLVCRLLLERNRHNMGRT